MWQRADAILEQATSANAKFLGLIVLSEAIRSRWKVLEGGDQARTGIKNFLVQKIIELSSDEVKKNIILCLLSMCWLLFLNMFF